MDLIKADEVLTSIAETIYQALPYDDWDKFRYFVRMAPARNRASMQLEAKLKNGFTDSPLLESASSSRLMDLLVKHHELSEEGGARPWFQMVLKVGRDGRFSTNFEYRDHYQIGDTNLDDVPPFK